MRSPDKDHTKDSSSRGPKLQDSLNARDLLENVAVKVRCLADIVACMEHEEHLFLSSEGIAGLYGFLDHIYNEIRTADACLRA